MRTQPGAILVAEGLDRQGERDNLPEERPELDLVAAKPARLDLVSRGRLRPSRAPPPLRDQQVVCSPAGSRIRRKGSREDRDDSARDSGCIRVRQRALCRGPSRIRCPPHPCARGEAAARRASVRAIPHVIRIAVRGARPATSPNRPRSGTRVGAAVSRSTKDLHEGFLSKGTPEKTNT